MNTYQVIFLIVVFVVYNLVTYFIWRKDTNSPTTHILLLVEFVCLVTAFMFAVAYFFLYLGNIQ